MLHPNPSARDKRISERKTRANILSMTRHKWWGVRLFDGIVRLLEHAVTPLSPQAETAGPPASILVLEYWNLGDLAILVPFLRNLRRAFPSARISLLINDGLESLFDGQGIVDEFIPVRVPWARHFHRWRKYNPFSQDWISFAHTMRALRKRRFDWAFSGRMDVRDNFMLWLVGARRRIGYGIGGGGSFLTDNVVPDLCHPHRSDVWLNLLKTVGLLPDGTLRTFELTNVELASARSYVARLGIPPDAFLVGVHPGARVATRRWGDERFAEVVRRLLEETDAHVLWFSAPGEGSQAPPWHCCHAVSLDLRHFVAALSLCRMLICNDSGPMHFANLVRVPVVAIFGPQRPEWFGPCGPRDRVVIRPEFSCRPCFDYCIFDEPYCLRTISTDEVYNVALDLFQQLTHGPTQINKDGDMEVLATHQLQPTGGSLV